MTAAWAVVACVGVATAALRAAGPVAVGGRRLPAALAGPLSALAPAVLAALVATNTLASGHRLVLDARAAGLAVAAVSVALRAPLLLVVVVAATTAALLRLAGWAA